MKVKKVLLIEDFPQLQNMISEQIKVVFGEDTNVLIAGSLEGAERFYDLHVTDIDLILMDTNLGGGVTTFALAERIGQEFNRPIVSISTNPLHRQKMMEKGCTHECEKSEIFSFLLKWKEDHHA